MNRLLFASGKQKGSIEIQLIKQQKQSLNIPGKHGQAEKQENILTVFQKTQNVNKQTLKILWAVPENRTFSLFF